MQRNQRDDNYYDKLENRQITNMISEGGMGVQAYYNYGKALEASYSKYLRIQDVSTVSKKRL